MKVMKYAKQRYLRVLIPAVIALVVYGNWASYVNQDTGHQLLSAIIEGGRAFTFTIIGNLLTEFMWSITSRIRLKAIRVPAAALLTWCTMQSIALSIHSSINPDTALKTIAPSLIVSSIYVTLYILGLSKISDEEPRVSRKIQA